MVTTVTWLAPKQAQFDIDQKLSNMSIIFFNLALLLICFEKTRSTSTTYLITTNRNICGNTSSDFICQTLSQFATSYLVSPDTTLFLQDGNHRLNKTLNISNINYLTIHPYSSTAGTIINCEGYWPIQFFSITTLNISNVSFMGCKVSVTNTTGGLILRNCKFEGQHTTKTALMLKNVSHVRINQCVFTSNRESTTIGWALPPYNITRSTVGGAIFATCSNISISHSRFENNSAGYGGAIFTQWQSSIVIINSTFINNTARAFDGCGGALYDYQGTVHILTSIFSFNIAIGSKGSGGALYFFENVTKVRNCSFSKNNATYGEVQRGSRCTAYFSNGAFTFDSAISWEGVMDNKDGSNITIKSCHFESNSVRGMST